MNVTEKPPQQMPSQSFLDTDDGYVYFRIDVLLNQTLTVAMMVMSVVGNILAIMVLSRKAFRHLPMSVYLRFLAVMDAGAVVTGLTHRFTLAAADYDFRETGTIPCRLQVFAVYVFTELGAWTLIMVTSERVLCILRPHKVKLLCTKFKSFMILLMLSLVFFTANLPILFMFGRKYKYDAATNVTVLEPCVPTSSDAILIKVWFLSHFFKQSLLPFMLIFVMNIIMIFGLYKRKEFLGESVVQTGGAQRGRQDSERSEVITQNSMISSSSHRSVSSAAGVVVTSPPMTTNNVGNSSSSSKRETSLTVNLILVNVVFLACTFPIGIYQQIVPRPPERDLDHPSKTLTFSMLVFVLYLNNTLNIFLYCANGSRFKKELSSMIQETKVLFCQRFNKS